MSTKLKDVMRNLRIECKSDGYELHTAAGVAYYNAFGVRGRVEGIPEYFPITISVKTDSTESAKKDCNITSNAAAIAGELIYQVKINAAAQQLGKLNPKAADDAEKLSERIADAIAESVKPGGVIHRAIRSWR